MKFFLILLVIMFNSCGTSQRSSVYDYHPRDPVLNNRNVTIGWAENEVNDFILAYFRESMIDLKTSRYALDYVILQRVRDFTKEIISEHFENNNRLNLIVLDLGITIPSALPNEALPDSMNLLNTKSGLAFDKAYIDLIIKSHQYLTQLLERAQPNALDSRLKNWIDITLPLETKHLRDAEEIRQQLK